jgi:hypothetical protein
MALNRDEVDSILGFESQNQPALTKGVLSQQLEASVEQRPWYTRLSTKVMILGGFGLLLTWLIFNLFSSSEPQAKSTAKEDVANQLLQSQLDAQRQQTDELKTQMAIGDQQKMIPVKPMTIKQKPVTSAAVSYPRSLPVRSGPPALPPAPTLSRSTFSRPAAPPPTFPVRSLPTLSIPEQRQLITSVPESSQPQEDPMAAWARLSGLGHYTSGESGSSAVVASSATSASYTPAVYTQSGPSTPIESPYSGGGAPAASNFPAPSETTSQSPALGSFAGTTLNVGTTAKGKLVTPILWAGDIDIKDQEFLVELKDGLGKALPKGTIIAVTPEQTLEAGFIRLKAVRASVNGSDQILPSGIQVVAANGGYIKASKKGTGGRGVGSILAGALLSGISSGAGELIKPQSQTFTTANGFSQSVTTNQVNPWAGVAQGATESLATGLQSQLDQNTPASPYYQVSKGTAVTVVVTQSVAL